MLVQLEHKCRVAARRHLCIRNKGRGYSPSDWHLSYHSLTMCYKFCSLQLLYFDIHIYTSRPSIKDDRAVIQHWFFCKKIWWLSVLWVLPLLPKILLTRELMLAYVPFGLSHPRLYGYNVLQGVDLSWCPWSQAEKLCNTLPTASGSLWTRGYEIWQSTTKLDRWRLPWPCGALPEWMSLPRTDHAKISELVFSGAKSSLTGFISLGSRPW